jgi:sec-independent protein translocase protein TatA
MISAPGPLELIVILVVALIFLGPKRLPDAARSLGTGVREFRDSLSGERDDHGYDEEPDEDGDEPDEVEAADPEELKEAAAEAVKAASEHESAGDTEPAQKQS